MDLVCLWMKQQQLLYGRGLQHFGLHLSLSASKETLTDIYGMFAWLVGRRYRFTEDLSDCEGGPPLVCLGSNSDVQVIVGELQMVPMSSRRLGAFLLCLLLPILRFTVNLLEKRNQKQCKFKMEERCGMRLTEMNLNGTLNLYRDLLRNSRCPFTFAKLYSIYIVVWINPECKGSFGFYHLSSANGPYKDINLQCVWAWPIKIKQCQKMGCYPFKWSPFVYKYVSVCVCTGVASLYPFCWCQSKTTAGKQRCGRGTRGIFSLEPSSMQSSLCQHIPHFPP